MSYLIKRDALADFHPLADEDMVPATWNGDHVGLRMTEAMATLRMLPGDGGMAASAWPPYLYEFDDLVAQKLQGELERTHTIQNRTRLSPSLNDITRMETAIRWPMQYLMFGAPHLVAPVVWLSHAHSMERDVAWVVRKRGGFIDTWLDRYANGCAVIADGLMVEKVPVF